MIRYARRPITLLEVLIIFTLLAILIAVVGVSMHKALVDQRFRTEVSSVVDQLRLAQNIMLILNTDVSVVFQESEKGDGIEYWLKMDTLLQPNMQGQVAGRKAILKTVKGVFFHDERAFEVKEGRLEVNFLSSGAVMSRGVMRLATSDKERDPPPKILQTYICLPGYPCPIRNVDNREEADKECTQEEEASDRKLTEDTLFRLPEKVKQLNRSQPEEEQEEKKPSTAATPTKPRKKP